MKNKKIVNTEDSMTSKKDSFGARGRLISYLAYC